MTNSLLAYWRLKFFSEKMMMKIYSRTRSQSGGPSGIYGTSLVQLETAHAKP
jgi:hypothetical protein